VVMVVVVWLVSYEDPARRPVLQWIYVRGTARNITMQPTD